MRWSPESSPSAAVTRRAGRVRFLSAFCFFSPIKPTRMLEAIPKNHDRPDRPLQPALSSSPRPPLPIPLPSPLPAPPFPRRRRRTPLPLTDRLLPRPDPTPPSSRSRATPFADLFRPRRLRPPRSPAATTGPGLPPAGDVRRSPRRAWYGGSGGRSCARGAGGEEEEGCSEGRRRAVGSCLSRKEGAWLTRDGVVWVWAGQVDV